MKRVAALFLVLMMIMTVGGNAMADYREEAWYADAMQGSEVSLGNNLRLKR